MLDFLCFFANHVISLAAGTRGATGAPIMQHNETVEKDDVTLGFADFGSTASLSFCNKNSTC